MIRTFKYRLHPTKDQIATFENWLGYCYNLYNAALEQRIDARRKGHKTPTLYDQYRQLTELRQSMYEWATPPTLVLRSALDRINKAFKGFFRRCKIKGEKPGFPRFKSKKRYTSFSLGKQSVELQNNKVWIPRLGNVRLNLYRPLGGIIKESIVNHSGGKWWISFACEIGPVPARCSPIGRIGLDLGILSFATLSNGEKIDKPKFLKESEGLLARRQRALSSKQKISKSRQRAKILVAKTYKHIHNQHLDFARKLAKRLFKEYDFIAFENLNIRNMIKNSPSSNISKSIYDASWYQFTQCLKYKAEEAGKWAVGVEPAYTSQICSGCGNIVKKDITEREHLCDHCGLILDRDHNAAINILRLGRSLVKHTKDKKIMAGYKSE